MLWRGQINIREFVLHPFNGKEGGSMSKKKLSTAYRLLRKLGLNYSEEEYGQVTFWLVFKKVCKTYRDGFLLKFVMNSWLLDPLAPR